MPKILDKLSKLIVGSSLEDLKDVQKSLDRLKNITTTTEVGTFSELIRNIYDKKNDQNKNQDIYTSMQGILKEYGLELNDVKIEQDRLARYQEYNAIVRKIPYMKRALKVITQNILNPEDYTKQSIKIFKNTTEMVNDEHEDLYKRELFNLIQKYEIEDYIYDIVYNTLKLGDYFVEILLLDEVLKKYKLLQESYNYKISETIKIDNKKLNINLEFQQTKFLSESDSLDLRDLKVSKDSIYLNFLSPEYVVRLGDRFCLGFLVFKTINDGKALKGINSSVEKLVQQGTVDQLAGKLIKSIKQRNKYFQNLIKTETDLKYTLARFLATYINAGDTNDINFSVRFVPPELMEHFTINRSEFRPYGTSIFYGSEFLSKIVVAIQSSIMIQRLSRSVEKRIIRVDIGSTRDARRYLTEVKQQFTRRRYSVDSIGTIDEIPSNLSTFEDIYIPMKNGRSPIEFDTLTQVGDLSTRVDDLKSLRDSLVASTDVPPPYLGIEENTESKAQLTQENVVFAASIISYQKEISKHLTNLIQKVLLITEQDNSKLKEYFKFVLAFDPPVTIVMEHKSEYMNSVTSLIDSLSNLGIPKQYLVNKFIPEFQNWEVETAKIKANLEKVYKKDENQNEESGGFGEFGGGFGGTSSSGGNESGGF